MTNFQRTAAWLHACGKTRSAQDLSVQIGCHIEEVVEFFDQLEIEDQGNNPARLTVACDLLLYLASALKMGHVVARIPAQNRERALDALCDSEVTGNGVAYLAHMDKERADRAVLDANEAKLVDGKPIILKGGKIGKPEGWKPPNLGPFV